MKENIENGAEALRKVDLTNVSEAVREYNDRILQESVSAWISASMDLAMVENEEAVPPPSFADIEERHQSALEQAGLALEPMPEDQASVWHAGNTNYKEGRYEIRLTLSNAEQFVKYLQSLDPAGVSESQIKAISEFFKTTRERFSGDRKLTADDIDLLVDLYADYGKIKEVANRLDMEGVRSFRGSVAAFEDLVIAAQGGYLNEYRTAVAEKLLYEIGGTHFGPSRWHGDSSEESYGLMWQDALEATRKISSNPKALDLRRRVISNLLASLDYAERDMREHPSENESADRASMKLTVITEAREALKKLQS